MKKASKASAAKKETKKEKAADMKQDKALINKMMAKKGKKK